MSPTGLCINKIKPNGFHALADNILMGFSSKHQTIYWKYKGIEIVIKTIIYLGDTHITGDCNRSDMCIPWPIGVVIPSY